jgi:hypothetical protein
MAGRTWLAAVALITGLGLVSVASLHAQVLDSLRADSVRADSLRADSLLRRQANQTERFLEALQSGRVQVPTLPALGAEGPRADGARIVFTSDSAEWSMAETLGDLVSMVPGAYLLRTGWLGASELPGYRGRGATSVEYYLDGLPYVAVGIDSVSIDPSTMALSLYERVEIEPWPALVRVFLYTRRHDRIAPRSLIGLGRGTNSLTAVEVQLEKRGLRGLGFGAAADYYNTGNLPGTSGDFYRNTQLWLQGSYLPNRHRGIVAQLVRVGPSRDDLTGSTGAVARGLQGGRSDIMVRAFARRREDGLGPLAALTWGWTDFGGEAGLSQQIHVVTGSFAWRSPTLGATVSASWRSRWTPLDARVSAGWTPGAAVGLNVEGGFQLHDGDRRSAWVGAQASLRPLKQVVARGGFRAASLVQAPSLAAEQAQSLVDLSGSLAWEGRFLGVEAGLAQAGAFRALPFETLLPVIASIDAPARTNWFTARGRLSPFPWVGIEAWYSTALDGAPQGQPGEHLLAVGSIRSKFLRTFPSGAFDLKVQLGVERWGAGVLGRDGLGAEVVLPSQLYLQTRLEIGIQSFRVYVQRANLLGELSGYVPGFPIATRATIFGVRWGFWN